ncbi:MAG: CT583 family protein [Simkaniaceae bacterium]|nr:CT583 family protein [Simkaniaceae bacterium]
MSEINSILAERLKSHGEHKSKMSELAHLSSEGKLSSFSGVFQVANLSLKDASSIEELLSKYKGENCDLKSDLESLTTLTSEIKAITNQAVILHGQRIKKAQEILKNYTDGAFSAWLVQTYGNRQTPYNFLQYFELYSRLAPPLREKMDEMPRQAVYSLSSRKGPQKSKEQFISEYQGENKRILLEKLRRTFPLAKEDKRAQNLLENVIKDLQRASVKLEQIRDPLSKIQKQELSIIIEKIKKQIG